MRFDEASIKKRIQTLLEEIHTQADPELLNRCRSIFRREVSFFRRSYMAAYLLLLEQDKHPASSAPRGGFSGAPERSSRPAKRSPDQNRPESSRSKNPPQEGRPPRERPQDEAPRVMIPEEESVRLFVSIGRNRKVFPREILALISAKTQVSRDDVGAIRILDNYSFVQVRNTAADTLIEALNGQNFRGRTLTVNYARARREEDAPANEEMPEGASAVSGEASSVPEAVFGETSAVPEETSFEETSIAEPGISDEAPDEDEASEETPTEGEGQGSQGEGSGD